MSRQSFNWVFVSLVFAACQSTTSPTDSPSSDPPPQIEGSPGVAVGPERAANVARHVALAFRPKNGALVGGYRTQTASVDDHGAIAVTPFTFDKGERTARSELTLETASIAVDEGVIATTATATRLENGSVVIQRGEHVEEHLTNVEDGLHQEWRFAQAPPIAGDLVVEVAVGGYDFTTSTASGLHFATNGVGFRYSHAVWVSGDGVEWPITAIHDAGRIRMTVPEGIVAKTVFPAVLDPIVTAEVAVDSPVAGSSGANAQHASVAFDGTNYLVVWDDNRNSQEADIWGTRVSAAGAVLDPLGIEIAEAAGVQANPVVAFDGTTFVVAWEDFRVTGGTTADISAARVSTAGVVTSLGLVSTLAATETQPHIAAANGNTLLVWNAAGDIMGSVRTIGSFGAPFGVATTAASETDPAVAVDPAGNHLVVWSEGATADLRGQFVTPAGALSGAAMTISAGAGGQTEPAATFDGTNYDVVWTNNSGGINIFGTRVSTMGTVLDTRLEGAVTVGGKSINSAAENQQNPDIACDAAGCLVVWQDRRNLATTGFDIRAQRLALDFTLAGAEFVITTAANNQFAPAVATNGTGFFGAWQDNRNGNEVTVIGNTISDAGALGTDAPIVGGNNRETGPAIGRAGTNFALVWSDSRTFGNDIRYVRFNAAGARLDASSLVASSGANAEITPAASADLGGRTLVVWSDTRNNTKDIFGTRIDLANNTVLDLAGIPIGVAANDQLVVDVASSGTVALVVWQDRRSGVFDIFGALVDANGTIVVSDIVISNAANDQTRPSVTFDTSSGQFIVVWSDGRTTGRFDIFATRVSTAGVVLDPTGVLVSTAANSRFSPAITSSTAGSFAVWEDRRAGQDIFGSRLTGGASLTVLDPAGVAVSQAAAGQTAPKVVTLSGFYTVVWVDARNTQTDIFGQQLDTNGVLQGVEFAVANSADSETNVTITEGNATQARVAYESLRFETRRVNTRLISATSATGQVCSGPTQCSTGFCVDGFCCDSACGGNHVPAGPGNTAGDCHACANKFTDQADGVCAPVRSGTICRNYGSTFCDLRETCDGTNLACPGDLGRRQGQACSKSTNVPAEAGTGVCPPNAAPGPHKCL